MSPESKRSLRLLKFAMDLRTLAALALLITAVPLAGQWPDRKDPRTPRTADGKPNLSGPAPKLPDGRPDFSGIWLVDDNRLQFNLMLDGHGAELLPADAAIYKERLAGRGKDRPSGHCLPHGIPDAMMVPSPFKIVHTPAATLILYEEFVEYRQVFTDGRALPRSLSRPGSVTRSAAGRATRLSPNRAASTTKAGWMTTAIRIPTRCTRSKSSAEATSVT